MGVQRALGVLALIGLVGLVLLAVGVAGQYGMSHALIAAGSVLIAAAGLGILGARPYLAGGAR